MAMSRGALISFDDIEASSDAVNRVRNSGVHKASFDRSGYCVFMRVAHTKNGFPPKKCERCGLMFEWRKKWQRDWDSVKYCSERCKRTS